MHCECISPPNTFKMLPSSFWGVHFSSFMLQTWESDDMQQSKTSAPCLRESCLGCNKDRAQFLVRCGVFHWRAEFPCEVPLRMADADRKTQGTTANVAAEKGGSSITSEDARRLHLNLKNYRKLMVNGKTDLAAWKPLLKSCWPRNQKYCWPQGNACCPNPLSVRQCHPMKGARRRDQL